MIHRAAQWVRTPAHSILASVPPTFVRIMQKNLNLMCAEDNQVDGVSVFSLGAATAVGGFFSVEEEDASGLTGAEG